MSKTLLKGSTASKKLLTLIAIMGLGSMQVMADTSIVGPEDNLNDGYYTGGHKKNYTLEPGKTIKIEFTVSTATDDQLEGDVWNPWYAWAVNFWDGTLNAITVEPRNYGYEANTDGINRWTENWAKYWEINYPQDWESGYNFRDNMLQGATVVTTIKRVGADVIIIYDITTTSKAKYRQYVVKTYGDGTQTIWFDLIVNHTHITIDNDKTVTTDTENVTGTLIGSLNRCAGYTTAESKKENFVIAPEGTLNLKFRNFSAGLFTWQSWMFEMLYNGKYCNMVAGNLTQWGELRSANGTFTNTNWPATDANILEKMEGALVDLTIQRSGASVTVTAVHTPVSGDPFTLNYEFSSNEDGFATSDAEFHLISDFGYLDLPPATTPFDLTLADGSNAHGTVTFSVDGSAATQAKKDDVVTVSVTPNESYSTKDVTVRSYTSWDDAATILTNGGDAPGVVSDIEVSKNNENGTWTFTMPEANVWIVVTYAKNLQNSFIQSIADQTYTGEAIEPTVVVKDGTTTLTLNTDYKVTYTNNVNTGTATVTVTGTGNYSGTATATFTIRANKTNMNDAIAEAETYYNIIKDGYPDAAAPLLEAINAAKSVKNKVDATQAEVETATTALASAKATAVGIAGYIVNLMDDTDDAGNWTITPSIAKEGQTVTVTYTGKKKIKSIKAIKE